MAHNLDATPFCILLVVRDIISFKDVTEKVMSGFIILPQSIVTAMMLIHGAV